MKKILSLSLCLPLFYSCGPLDSELPIPEDGPVVINEEAIPSFKPSEEPKAETPAPDQTDIIKPKNTLGLLTPSLHNALPEESDIFTQPSFDQTTIDDNVEEATTIRATE